MIYMYGIYIYPNIYLYIYISYICIYGINIIYVLYSTIKVIITNVM